MRVLAALASLLLACTPVRADDLLAAAQASHRNRLAVIETEFGRDQEQVRLAAVSALRALEDRFAAAGQLQPLVQCQAALKLAEAGFMEWEVTAAAPDLLAAQRKVLQAVGQAQESRQRKRDTLRAQYTAHLDRIKISLTREKRVEEALRVQAEIDRLRADAAPVPATPALATAPAAPPAAPATDARMWMSFEEEEDLKRWEFRTGGAGVRDSAHATHGRHALRINAGSLIATEAAPRDWTGYGALMFEVFHAGKEALQLEVLIGDSAWLGRQTYANRHNRWISLAPGANRVVIPLSDLYRGEDRARNADIPRNLDLDAIRFLSLTVPPAAGTVLHLDGFRLVKGTGPWP